MTTVKQAPGQPYLQPDHRFDWEQEETLVDRRRRLPYRIARMIRRLWLPALILGIVVVALLDAEVMRSIVNILGFLFQLMFAIGYILFQFIVMFWFLARTRMYTIMPGQGTEGVSFKDYRGQPEILEQAEQIVTLLRGVKAFEKSGGEPLNGLLLEGPPGTGKTWLAQAISTEAGVPFFYLDTSSLQAMFMGVGPMKVMRLYARARKAAKEYGAAVIFLDEIDALGARGGVAQTGGNNNNPMGGFMGGDMGLLSTMLIEMSGFSLEHGWRAKLRTWFYKVIMRRNPPPLTKRLLTIGATNRISALDPALLRPGRFDKKLRVDVPDMDGRRDIFEYYMSKMSHDETMIPAVLASETPGYTPADIKYLLNESLRYALFDGRRYMTYRDFQIAKPEHEMGLRAPIKNLSKEAKERLAYHEAGHAVAVRVFMPYHRISRITIIRQGAAFGHVYHYPAREAYQGLNTSEQYRNRLCVSVAGKAAEVEFCGLQNQTLGVGGDFFNIRMLLRQMALAGMLGPLGGAASFRFSMFGVTQDIPPEMAQAMEETFQDVLQVTRKALREHGHVVRDLVALLMEREELLADEVREFFDRYGLTTPDPTLIKDGEEVRLLPDEVLTPPARTPTQAVAGTSEAAGK
ncbi:MAG: AAA family ATPase [Anaerolineae bacterium]|nr:AAA family ATPase [Anaerolineae bacterium]